MPARLIAAVCLLGVFAVSLPAYSLAQARQPRVHGPWLGAGLGTASARVNCEICANDRNGGLSGYLTGGLTITRGLRAGAEVAGWFDTTDEVKQSLALYGASLYWNPQPTGAWYLKGGLGLLHYHADTQNNPDDDPLNASAAALQLGGGYDLRASRRLWFTPFANLIVSTSGNLTSGNTIVTGASFSLLQLGAGVTWR